VAHGREYEASPPTCKQAWTEVREDAIRDRRCRDPEQLDPQCLRRGATPGSAGSERTIAISHELIEAAYTITITPYDGGACMQ